MPSNKDFTVIKDARSDADSPTTEELWQDTISNTNHNNALVRSDGTAIYIGAIDSDPTNATSSDVIDAGPTGGAIANVLVNMTYEVTNGTALGTRVTINQKGSGSSRLTVSTNLFSAGMRSGDTYAVIYGIATDRAHDHDGVNSPKVSFNDLDDTGALGQYKAASFTSATSTGNQAVTGVGFQPSSVMIWAGENNFDTDNDMVSHAAYDGTDVSGNRFSHDDSANASSAGTTTNMVHLLKGDGTAVWVATAVSLDADGFTINWGTTQSPATTTLRYLAEG